MGFKILGQVKWIGVSLVYIKNWGSRPLETEDTGYSGQSSDDILTRKQVKAIFPTALIRLPEDPSIEQITGLF